MGLYCSRLLCQNNKRLNMVTIINEEFENYNLTIKKKSQELLLQVIPKPLIAIINEYIVFENSKQHFNYIFNNFEFNIHMKNLESDMNYDINFFQDRVVTMCLYPTSKKNHPLILSSYAYSEQVIDIATLWCFVCFDQLYSFYVLSYNRCVSIFVEHNQAFPSKHTYEEFYSTFCNTYKEHCSFFLLNGEEK